MSNYESIARAAAVDAHGELAVGEFVGVLQENQDQVLTYLFASKVKGYPDWNIGATLFITGSDATVSEVFFAPGDQSLVAPKWVPWSERLADYKALQAALEAEAAAAALEALEASEDVAEDDADEVDDQNSVVEIATEDEGLAAEEPETLAVADVPEAVEAESNADAGSGLGKGLFKWKKLRSSKKRK
ncbi:MAG: hypothetical protein RIR34_111 [Actinomycetota bacterium]|jgi:hypothetical protein